MICQNSTFMQVPPWMVPNSVLVSMAASRDFDIALLGTTGYTGKLCAEHIAQHLPENLRWAIAGRSTERLEIVKRDLRHWNSSRLEPDILETTLDAKSLASLAQRTRVLINCVGPYHLYSTAVVEACAKHGTHYLDVTGETPWVREIIEKYHEIAKSTNALIIPSIGLESAPPDILSWSLAQFARQTLSTGVSDMVIVTHELKTSGPSGGTLLTILSVIEKYSLSDLTKSLDPWCLAAKPHIATEEYREPWLQRWFGVRTIPELGILTTSPAEMCDTATVHRSSTIMPELYGPKFRAQLLLRVQHTLWGIIIHIGFRMSLMALLLPPVRWLVKKFIYGPGQGPTKQSSKNDRVEYRAIATTDEVSNPRRILGSLSYENGPYLLSGLLLAEAAMVILTNEKVSNDFSGFATPAVLGHFIVDRLARVGVSIRVTTLED